MVWVDGRFLLDLITKGLAPRIVLKMMQQAVARFDDKTLKSFVHTVLGNVTEVKRKKILHRYLKVVKTTLSAEDKKALRIGRAAIRQMK